MSKVYHSLVTLPLSTTITLKNYFCAILLIKYSHAMHEQHHNTNVLHKHTRDQLSNNVLCLHLTHLFKLLLLTHSRLPFVSSIELDL